MGKGQVTAFIILGIVIIAIVGGLIYYRNQIIRDDFQSERERAALVPGQINPIRLFIDNCIAEVGDEGVNIIAFQGGHLQLEEDGLPVTKLNPFSNRLLLSSGSSANVPYWSYKAANGVRENQVPSLETMEKALADYVEINLKTCLDDLDLYNKQGYNITRRGIENIDVRILDNRVEVMVQQPIEVSYKDLDFTVEKHFGDVEKPLGLFYDIARQVYNKEESLNFIEEKTIDMMVVYDELPYSGTDFDCRNSIWSKSKVERDFRDILAWNLDKFRVEGTDYNLANRDNSYFELDLLDDRYNGINVGFSYSQNWPLKLDISPSDGELLKAESLNKDIGNDMEGFLTSLFCINNYHFIYDVRYPVLIDVTNDDFTFQYATQVEIDNNQPRENLLGQEEVIKADEICVAGSATIKVDTFEEKPNGELALLDEVDVKYKCITTTCNIGLSNNGMLEADFPVCLNGIVSGNKEGYGVAKELLSTNEANQLALVLEPIYEKNLEVLLIDKNSGEMRAPFESEQVVFEFNNEGFSTSVVWPETKTISLMPGNYEVKSYVIGTSTWDINIPKKEVESCVEVPDGFLGILGKTKKECTMVEIPGITLDEAFKGGANFNFRIEHFDLATSRDFRVYTIVDKLPGSYEDLSNVYDEADSILDERFRYPELI